MSKTSFGRMYVQWKRIFSKKEIFVKTKVILLTSSFKAFGNLFKEAMSAMLISKLYPKFNSVCFEMGNFRCQTCKCCFGAWSELKPEAIIFFQEQWSMIPRFFWWIKLQNKFCTLFQTRLNIFLLEIWLIIYPTVSSIQTVIS